MVPLFVPKLSPSDGITNLLSKSERFIPTRLQILLEAGHLWPRTRTMGWVENTNINSALVRVEVTAWHTQSGDGVDKHHKYQPYIHMFGIWIKQISSFRLKNQHQGVSDRLEIDPEESLTKWLGNPCPGVVKTLRVRYVSLEGVAKGHRREVWLQESKVGG